MKRSAMPRSTKPLARRTPLRTVAPLRRSAPKANAKRSGRARPGEPLSTWCEVAIDGLCTGRAEHRHHKLRRSRGGTDDRANTLDVCGRCHLDGIHAHPAESYARGWLIRGVA